MGVERSLRCFMRVRYKNQELMITETKSSTILKYHFQKIYYAILIRDCNRYSSIGNKQRVDVVMLNQDLEILSFKRAMHENTFFEEKNAVNVMLLPVDAISNLEVGSKFVLDKKDFNVSSYDKSKEKV